MVYKLTICGGLLRQPELSPAIKTLKQWEKEGKIQLFESDRAKETPASTLNPGWPGGERPASRSPRSRGGRPKDPNALSFQQLAALIFPTRPSNRLNMSEINDVAHLQQHHAQGRSIFVTDNVRDFVAEGKRERLRTVFKIVVLTPDEAVTFLEKETK